MFDGQVGVSRLLLWTLGRKSRLLIRSRICPYKTKHAEAGWARYTIIISQLLGEVMDVADISVMLVIGHVEGQQVARCSDVATCGGGGATQ
jgi:hypothetical protein